MGTAIEKLRHKLIEIKAGVALIFKKSDIFYLTGLDTPGVLIINENSPILFYPATEREITEEKFPAAIKLKEYINAFPWKEIFNQTADCKVALEVNGIELKKYRIIKENCREILDLEGFIEDMRSIKDNSEIELIKRASGHSVKIIDSINLKDWEGKTEAALAGYISSRAWEEGMEGLSFTPIVSTLKNSVYPHHIPGEDIIENLVMIDMGTKYKGYCSDLTRTFILDKFIKDYKLVETYESLKKAKDKAVSALSPGISCGEIYRVAIESLKEDNLSEYFIHGLGHGVGIDIHERPFLKPGSKEILKDGMVVTIEPGIYIKGFGGIRLEDIYLITPKGKQKLTGKYQ